MKIFTHFSKRPVSEGEYLKLIIISTLNTNNNIKKEMCKSTCRWDFRVYQKVLSFGNLEKVLGFFVIPLIREEILYFWDKGLWNIFTSSFLDLMFVSVLPQKSSQVPAFLLSMSSAELQVPQN